MIIHLILAAGCELLYNIDCNEKDYKNFLCFHIFMCSSTSIGCTNTCRALGSLLLYNIDFSRRKLATMEREASAASHNVIISAAHYSLVRFPNTHSWRLWLTTHWLWLQLFGSQANQRQDEKVGDDNGPCLVSHCAGYDDIESWGFCCSWWWLLNQESWCWR